MYLVILVMTFTWRGNSHRLAVYIVYTSDSTPVCVDSIDYVDNWAPKKTRLLSIILVGQ